MYWTIVIMTFQLYFMFGKIENRQRSILSINFRTNAPICNNAFFLYILPSGKEDEAKFISLERFLNDLTSSSTSDIVTSSDKPVIFLTSH